MANNILRQIGEQQRIELLSRNLPLPDDVILEEYSVDTNIFVRDSNLDDFIPAYIKDNYKLPNENLNLNGSNKYTAENPYDFGNDKTSKVFDIINGVSDVFRGNSLISNIGTGDFVTNSNLQNSILGRVLNNPNESELGRIGLERLGIIFAERASQQYLKGLIPTIDIRNDETGNISLKPNNWSISTPYVSDTRAFRFYYIGSPINEPSQRYRDHSLPPNTAGGMIDIKTPNDFLETDEFGRLVYDPSNLILSTSTAVVSQQQSKLGGSLEWEEQQSQRENLFENNFKGRNPYKRGILKFTQQIVNDGHSDNTDSYHAGKIITLPFRNSVEDGGDAELIGRGNRVGRNPTTGEGLYCRTWTKNRRYSTVDRLVRGNNSNDIEGNFLKQPNGSLSVLQDNGFVKVGYTKKGEDVADLKNFMLSIENLAWEGLTNDLPELERGKFGGRIMWFPPYDIQFSEQNTANWESTQFLGRIEPIYTYSNSERTGTLSFKVISDYPAIIDDNRFQSLDYDEFQKYFWGCTPDLPDSPNLNIENDNIKLGSQNKSRIPLDGVIAYFDNDITEIQPSWTGWTRTQYEIYSNFEDRLDDIISRIKTQFPNDKIEIEIIGNASKRCVPGPNIPNRDCSNYNNKELPNKRAKTLEKFILDKITDKTNITPKIKSPSIASILTNSPDSDAEINARFAKAQFYVISENSQSNNKFITKQGKSTNVFQDSRNEYIFEKITQDFIFEDEIEYNTLKDDKIINFLYKERLKEKLKHFHPSFHSTTPQGLNKRLTFLIQCTRPGSPLKVKDSENPSNSVFSKPPVCVLRLGDFYHTKIIIDNVNIDYDTLWDLNPEGIGVQPMIATVNINFKFIGGSSMAGPVSRLQNALQHNFFANTELYQRFERDSDKYIKVSDETLTNRLTKLSKTTNLPTLGKITSPIKTNIGEMQLNVTGVRPTTGSPDLSVAQDPPSPLRPSSKEYDRIEENLIESKDGSKIKQGTKQPKRLDDGFENLPCYPNCPDDEFDGDSD
jgi:hypothetical protein